MYVASVTKVLECFINYNPVMTLTYLWQGQHRSPMHLNGKIVEMSFREGNLQEMGKWTEDS